MTENVTGFSSLDNRLDDVSLMRFIVQQELNGLATSALVEVMAVHGDTVDVKPLVNQIDGAGTGIPHGIIHGLPWHAQRAGPCAIRVAPRVGDIGQAKFCHSDISSVKKTKKAANPSSRRRFDWSDGIYYGAVIPKEEATTIIEVDADNNVVITGPALNITVTDKVNIVGPVTSDTEYRINGTKVVGEQQGAITGPSGGGTVDSGARTAIDAILAALRAHGLIAS
ncbi:hypothetical protein [Novosphingobium colocasiae]|uniref:hypothetical protein n=1 Tax=Novosphingobium colocasiae TaxID=1256513 RepID=UPI0035B20BDF